MQTLNRQVGGVECLCDCKECSFRGVGWFESWLVVIQQVILWEMEKERKGVILSLNCQGWVSLAPSPSPVPPLFLLLEHGFSPSFPRWRSFVEFSWHRQHILSSTKRQQHNTQSLAFQRVLSGRKQEEEGNLSQRFIIMFLWNTYPCGLRVLSLHKTKIWKYLPQWRAGPSFSFLFLPFSFFFLLANCFLFCVDSFCIGCCTYMFMYAHLHAHHYLCLFRFVKPSTDWIAVRLCTSDWVCMCVRHVSFSAILRLYLKRLERKI